MAALHVGNRLTCQPAAGAGRRVTDYTASRRVAFVADREVV